MKRETAMMDALECVIFLFFFSGKRWFTGDSEVYTIAMIAQLGERRKNNLYLMASWQGRLASTGL